MEILIATIIGIVFGYITGLTPGVHINMVSLLVLSSSVFLLQFTSPVILAVFIVAMSVTHTFLDTLPSIFLGAPDSSTILSVLPGHRLLLEGRGYEAVALTIFGSLLAVLFSALIAPLLILGVSKIYSLIENYIAYILILISLILILKEIKSRFWAFIIFMMSGLLGLGVLNLNLSQPLFPLLSGLFGTSILILSIAQKTNIPKQKVTQMNIKKKDVAKAMGSGLFASILVGFLPGVGSSQAAIVATAPLKRITTETFLVLVGSLNTIVMILSFIALYTIDKARNGSVVVISKILETFNLDYLILFLGISLLVAGIATIIALKTTKGFVKIIGKVNYSKLCLSIIILVTILVIVFTGFLGLFVLTISTFVGMLPSLKGIGKNHLMGSLLLPVILFFLL